MQLIDPLDKREEWCFEVPLRQRGGSSASNGFACIYDVQHGGIAVILAVPGRTRNGSLSDGAVRARKGKTQWTAFFESSRTTVIRRGRCQPSALQPQQGYAAIVLKISPIFITDQLSF